MKLKLLIAVLVAQCAFLLGITAVQERVLAVGKTILLETERVDPRDLLRGDYLILNYKISSVPRNLFSPTPEVNPPVGAKVYVTVAEGPNHFYHLTRASIDELTPAANEILLCGTVSPAWWTGTGAIHLDYGIEKFFVAEGTGSPRGKLTVETSVSSSGRPTIKQVFIDGRPYAEVMKAERR